jgi:hypothetical protein
MGGAVDYQINQDVPREEWGEVEPNCGRVHQGHLQETMLLYRIRAQCMSTAQTDRCPFILDLLLDSENGSRDGEDSPKRVVRESACLAPRCGALFGAGVNSISSRRHRNAIDDCHINGYSQGLVTNITRRALAAQLLKKTCQSPSFRFRAWLACSAHPWPYWRRGPTL